MLLYPIVQMLVLGFDWEVEKPYYRRTGLLVIGGARTQVFADTIKQLKENAARACQSTENAVKSNFKQIATE